MASDETYRPKYDLRHDSLRAAMPPSWRSCRAWTALPRPSQSLSLEETFMGCCMTLSSPSVPTLTHPTYYKDVVTPFALVHAVGWAPQYLRTGSSRAQPRPRMVPAQPR
eukprot:4196577-Amphidinium_carterae.2